MPAVREEQLDRLKSGPLDVLVLGGGINGAGVIRDLALRSASGNVPLRVGLVEQHHFASGTSGKNSQLIHGGLRYLKYFQIHLVRESLRERSILLRNAPQYVRPLPLLLPMYGWKSRVLYGTGLWMYDRLAGDHGITNHRILDTGEIAQVEPDLSQAGLTAGAIFYDGAIDSARFVVENVVDAIENGAIAANYVKAESWTRDSGGRWTVSCVDALTGQSFEIRARKLIDARGPWSAGDSLRLVRGSHIIIPRMNASHNAIAHFEPDGRIIFVIPWGSRKQLTLVGTTDEDHKGGPDNVRITSHEEDYLLNIVRKLYPKIGNVSPISSYSSLRPLVKAESASAASASRGHKIWNAKDGILHIAGGKYTTYREMSEEAADLTCAEIAPALAQVHPTEMAPFATVEREIGDLMEQHLSDYLYVSTYLGYEEHWTAETLTPYAEALGARRGWDGARVASEVEAFLAAH